MATFTCDIYRGNVVLKENVDPRQASKIVEQMCLTLSGVQPYEIRYREVPGSVKEFVILFYPETALNNSIALLEAQKYYQTLVLPKAIENVNLLALRKARMVIDDKLAALKTELS